MFMRRKFLIIVVLILGSATVAFSQARPVLGILPFVGGEGGDGEAIATLISMEPEILRSFTVVPRTAALNAIFEEHRFQLEGLTDSDTIAGIGRMLNADYVLSGNIRQLEDRNLVIATIVNVETFEQVGGYFRTYRTIEEVRDFLPSMSRNMVDTAMRQRTARLPSLAMLPFTLAPGIDAQDAETLSKILAIEILNTGEYVVLPRTSTIQAALDEMDFQMLGYTEDAGMAALGRAINADMVLSAGVHRLGVLNLFTAQVLHVSDGSMFAGASRDYQVLADGIDLMSELAILLTDPNVDRAEARIAALPPAGATTAPRAAAPMPAPGRAPTGPRPGAFEDPSRFWSLGFSVGTSFAEPWAIGTLQATISPSRHTFLRIGGDIGFVSGVEDVGYFSIHPFAHYAFFVPFTRGGWYIGAGGGLKVENYDFGDLTISRNIFMVDLTTGLNIGNIFAVSYTLRTDFAHVIHRISTGFTIRFGGRTN